MRRDLGSIWICWRGCSGIKWGKGTKTLQMRLLLRNSLFHARSTHDRQSSACEHTDTFTRRWKHAMPTYWPHMFVCIYVKYILLGKAAAALLINCIVKEGQSYTAFIKEKQIKKGNIEKARVTKRLHHLLEGDRKLLADKGACWTGLHNGNRGPPPLSHCH